MGSEWTYCRLGDVATIQGGFAFKSRDFRESGVPVAKIRNVRNRDIDLSEADCVSEDIAKEHSHYYVREGDVLISMTGSGINAPASIVGRVARHSGNNGDFLINQRVGRFVVCDTEKTDLRYLYYFFSRSRIRNLLVSIATGSANQVNISAKQVESVELSLPPLREQKRIAHILGALDDKIELNRRMNRTLEAIARAIFKSWFIDFDPVIDNAILHKKPIPDEFAHRAEIRRQILLRNGEDYEGLSPSTFGRGVRGEGVEDFRHLFPDSFQDSPLGKIPEGWEVTELGDLLKLNRGSIKPQEYPTEEFDHFSIPAYDAGSPAREFGDTIRSSKYLVPPLAVLISKLNPHIPRVWLPNVFEDHRSVCSTEFLVCIPREGISREYIYSLLSSSAFLCDFAQMVTGTTGSHQRVRPTAFTAMSVVKPSQETLPAFAKSAEPLFARCASLSEESHSLMRTRDALLPRLMSGSLQVAPSCPNGGTRQ
jgi:type I restriction enzyme, S subunit